MLNPYQKEQTTEEHEDQDVLVMPEDSGSILEDEAKMSRIYSAELPIKVTINHYEDTIIILCSIKSLLNPFCNSCTDRISDGNFLWRKHRA